SLNLMGRKVPLHIYGPAELETLLKQMTPQGESYLFPLVFHTHRYDTLSLLLDTGSLKVYSFPLDHKIPTVGFLFRESSRELNIRKEKIPEFNLGIKDILRIKAGEDYVTSDGTKIPNRELTLPPIAPRSYAFCSDTRYNPDYVRFIQDVTLLYHEATYGHLHIERAKATRHTTAREAAMIARDARAGQLVIGHFSARYKSLDPLLDEAREIFPSTIAASDGQTISVPSVKVKDH
ncbi:MAG: ribonuclease Z, partial [Bacteroidales bacterium]|nr:ribonuclease Z [Bacteroidales bacterium]